MGPFLPSEIARLVLGYLEQQNCFSAYDEFLNTCPYLAECRGREFSTTLMGFSLETILNEYCLIETYVSRISSTRLKDHFKSCCYLPDKVKILIDLLLSDQNSKTQIKQNGDSRIRTRTKSVDLCHQNVNHSFHNQHSQSSESLVEATKLSDLPGIRGSWQEGFRQSSVSMPYVNENDKLHGESLQKTPTSSRDPRLHKYRSSAEQSAEAQYAKQDGIYLGLQTPSKLNKVSPSLPISLTKVLDTLHGDLNVSVKTCDFLNYSDLQNNKMDDIATVMLDESNNLILQDKSSVDKMNISLKDQSLLYLGTEKTSTPEELKNDFKELLNSGVREYTGDEKIRRPGSSTPDRKYSMVRGDSSVKTPMAIRVTPKKSRYGIRRTPRRNTHNALIDKSITKRIEEKIRVNSMTKNTHKSPIQKVNQKHMTDTNHPNKSKKNSFPNVGKAVLQNKDIGGTDKTITQVSTPKNVIILSNEKVQADVLSDRKIVFTTTPEVSYKYVAASKNAVVKEGDTVVLNSTAELNKDSKTFIVAAKTEETLQNSANQIVSDTKEGRLINVPLISISAQNYHDTSAKFSQSVPPKRNQVSKNSSLASNNTHEFVISDGKIQIVQNFTGYNLSDEQYRTLSDNDILTMPTVIMLPPGDNTVNLPVSSGGPAPQRLGYSNNLTQMCSYNSPNFENSSVTQSKVSLCGADTPTGPNHSEDNNVASIQIRKSRSPSPLRVICSNLVALPITTTSKCDNILEDSRNYSYMTYSNHTQGDVGSFLPKELKGTPEIEVSKKHASSTPRRKDSHVRVLDFGTPPGSISNKSPRKAHTQPKLQFHNTGAATPLTNLTLRSRKAQSRLFTSVAEENSHSSNNENCKKKLSKKKTKCEKDFRSTEY